jgi:hypothetical protein
MALIVDKMLEEVAVSLMKYGFNFKDCSCTRTLKFERELGESLVQSICFNINEYNDDEVRFSVNLGVESIEIRNIHSQLKLWECDPVLDSDHAWDLDSEIILLAPLNWIVNESISEALYIDWTIKRLEFSECLEPVLELIKRYGLAYFEEIKTVEELLMFINENLHSLCATGGVIAPDPMVHASILLFLNGDFQKAKLKMKEAFNLELEKNRDTWSSNPSILEEVQGITECRFGKYFKLLEKKLSRKII